MKVLPLSYGHSVSVDKIGAILSYGSAPLKRLASEAEKANTLLDTTNGKKARSLIVLDSGHVVKSAVDPDTLRNRIVAMFSPTKKRK